MTQKVIMKGGDHEDTFWILDVDRWNWIMHSLGCNNIVLGLLMKGIYGNEFEFPIQGSDVV